MWESCWVFGGTTNLWQGRKWGHWEAKPLRDGCLQVPEALYYWAEMCSYKWLFTPLWSPEEKLDISISLEFCRKQDFYLGGKENVFKELLILHFQAHPSLGTLAVCNSFLHRIFSNLVVRQQPGLGRTWDRGPPLWKTAAVKHAAMAVVMYKDRQNGEHWGPCNSTCWSFWSREKRLTGKDLCKFQDPDRFLCEICFLRSFFSETFLLVKQIVVGDCRRAVVISWWYMHYSTNREEMQISPLASEQKVWPWFLWWMILFHQNSHQWPLKGFHKSPLDDPTNSPGVLRKT
jgi:hypothetical protein